MSGQEQQQSNNGKGKGNRNRNRNRNGGKGKGNPLITPPGQGWQPPTPNANPQNASANANQGGQGGKGGKGNKRKAQAQPAKAQAQSEQQFGQPVVINPNARTSSTTLSQMTESCFVHLPLHDNTQRALAEVLGYQTMTKVQAMSIPVALGPDDVMVKAKTGTGKTLAFLIPSIEKLAVRSQRGPLKTISILCISPTRELASQIMAEGQQLTKFHQLHLQVVYGGTNVKSDLSKMRQRMPDILVATPGRLNDLLENHGLQQQLSQLQNLIFDEADQLLEMGFRPAITQMLTMLPPKNSRQTLLFSATMPKVHAHLRYPPVCCY